MLVGCHEDSISQAYVNVSLAGIPPSRRPQELYSKAATVARITKVATAHHAMQTRLAKFEENLRSRLSPQAADRVLASCSDQKRLEQMPVPEFVSLFVV